MQIKSKFYAAMLCAVPSIVYAASDENLGEVVVTATRLEQPLNQSLASTTVITAQDIRDSQAPDVPTILRNVAGVEISQNGGIGKSSGVFLRGTNSDDVLVLVDGVRINSATTGMTSLDQIMLDQVDHIEVVRGNVSSLYGSEAIGGVIQIFTKHGHGAPSANVSAGLGSQGTRRLSTGFGGATDGTDFNVQLSTLKTDGVSALNTTLVPNANPDQNGYRNNSISANLGHTFNSDHRVSATLFGSNGNNQYDSAFNPNPADANTNREQIWKFSLATDDQITKDWHSKLQLANGVDQYRDFLNGIPSAFGSLFQTTSNQLTWQNTLHLDDSKQLLMGAESLQQKVSSDINPGYAQDSRTVNSVFAGYTGRYDVHQLQANLRQDRNSQYGDATTGLLGYGYSLTDAWRVTTSYSTAFKAPTFNDLYYPGYGNPALKPEHARNFEAGTHYSVTGGQQFDAVYFDNHIRDMINAVLVDPVNYVYQAQNVSRARMNGFEFNYAGRFGDTGVKAALTSQNPRDETTGLQLDRRSKLHGSFGLTQQLGVWQLGGEWMYSGTRPDASSTQTLAAYNVFNLTAGYAISKDTKLSLRADNLTNQNDSNAYGYNPLGRRVFAGISYQMQ
ncbi:vitamin B12 transporter BtuB precursor [mine drainage metagenome]|uniref:Vitamin B12 transporter BtuB n=1 Tax=mine drainage metagenome TaxID=410659 RepID=A0A1J5TPY4_9ZZZZ